MGGQLLGRYCHEREEVFSRVALPVSLNYCPVGLTLVPWVCRYVCTHQVHCINASSAVGCKPPSYDSWHSLVLAHSISIGVLGRSGHASM